MLDELFDLLFHSLPKKVQVASLVLFAVLVVVLIFYFNGYL